MKLFASTGMEVTALVILISSSAAAQPVAPSPEVRLLKSSVLLHEPVYAEVLQPTLAANWKTEISARRDSVKWYEVKRGVNEEWARCKDKDVIVDPVHADDVRVGLANVSKLGVAWLRTCGLDAVGKYWIRWGGGRPTALEIRPIPPLESAGSELMTGRGLTLQLATSVYAGYVLVGPAPPGKPFGPDMQARSRRFYEQLVRDSTQELRNENMERLRLEIASQNARVELLSAQLIAHPEFVFADNVRLELAGSLTFLTRCREASEWLAKVTDGQWLGVAKEFSVELEAVRKQSDSVCAGQG
jgi:hypothetical protein